MTPYALPNDLENIVLTLCEGLATPVSLAVAILLRYGEYDQIASKRVDPKHYNCERRYWSDNTAVEFLRKCEGLPTTFDRKAKAVENFWAGEHECFRTNSRLSHFVDSQLNADATDVAERVIVAARKKIMDILGPYPPDIIVGKFGPGATFGDLGMLTTVPDKMTSRPSITSDALPFLFQWTGTAWATACASSGRDPEFIRGNRFTTVPKDCVKDRGIAVEPSINLFYQLGFGRILKSKLKAYGIDLRFGQDIHRQVACEASIRGHLATIDLKNASDTVCINLVRLLLPPRWFEVLFALRSPKTLIDGKWILLEKFSSMGNGFTFELETLIFLALSLVAVESDGSKALPGVNVHTYGDDIIVPTTSSENVIAVLRFFGMTVNLDKTFLTGPFRESCGGDFFNGTNVRPFQLKEFPSEPQHYIAMANGVRRLAFTDSYLYYRDASTRRAWFRILDALPSDVRRLRGPQGLGDLVIHDHQEFWWTHTKNCIRYIRTWRPARLKRVGWEHFRPDVVLATALYGVGDGALGVMPRDAVDGYKKGWVPYS